ncbi:terminase small subunit, YqaS homolog [Geomicrobium sp. JCM 19037]|uniref:hypothetical protein n=1 Tax=Geomicrobium sp. JCM 19037 TaxID=1460634 RepID=UPI00045F49FB|nr:hypothetical protein [Geomicrobium sp. JCM 19037]GAK03109.1 terminase small subunit, YqaS homolog [Geomicrobium sp. JCM 19037]
MEHFENEDQIAKLKRNIAIQEAAIIRSQKIMYVDDKNELIKELKKKQKGNVSGEEWEIQFAWDRQGNYLNSLSRAMTTLVSMYKQLDELTRDSGEDVQTSIGSFVDALKDNVEDVWDDEQE